jgi:hypothetical protein
MSQDDNAPALLAYIDAEQLRLRDVLSGKDEATLAARPANGQWSVVENVRHLLFAEQLHLGRFVPGGQQWSTVGLTPNGMRDKERFRMVGSAATTSVREVLEAWAAVHVLTLELAQHDSEEVRGALQRNLKHLRNHIKRIESLLRVRRERQSKAVRP